MTERKINVSNFEQRVLLAAELNGQISDGYWENSYPNNHWQSWCKAKVEVNPDNLGTNFRPARVYKFDSNSLLKVVKARMVFYVRLAKVLYPMAELMNNKASFPLLIEQLRDLEHLFDTIEGSRNSVTDIEFKGIPDYIKKGAEEGDEFWIKRMNLYKLYIHPDGVVSPFLLQIAGSIYDKTKYSMAELRKDLEELNEIQKKRIK